MQGHQGDPVARSVIRINVTEERYLLKVIEQRGFFCLLVILCCCTYQFGDVFESAFSLLASIPEGLFQSGFGENALGNGCHFAGNIILELLYHIEEGGKFSF
ncbi:hypothetical protein ES707_20894 [subsurface metagenome]